MTSSTNTTAAMKNVKITFAKIVLFVTTSICFKFHKACLELMVKLCALTVESHLFIVKIFSGTANRA